MTVDQLNERIEAIAARYGLTPLERLELKSDLLDLLEWWQTGGREVRLAQCDEVFGTEKAA